MAVTYNDYVNLTHLYRATNGGTVFSGNLNTQTDFDYFEDSCVANDAIYFGYNGSYDLQFRSIKVNIGTPFSAVSVTFIWEYRTTTGGWSTLDVTDGTNNWSNTGVCEVIINSFPTNWSTNSSVNGVYCTWIRCRIVSVDTPSEGGANTTDTVKVGNNTITITGYASGTIPYTMTDIYNASVSGGWNVITKQGNQFFSLASISVSAGGTPGYFKSTNEHIQIGDNTRRRHFCAKGGEIVLGDLNTDGYGYNGSSLIVYGKSESNGVATNTGQWKVYGSYVYLTGTFNCEFDFAGLVAKDSVFNVVDIGGSGASTTANLVRCDFIVPAGQAVFFRMGAGTNIIQDVRMRLLGSAYLRLHAVWSSYTIENLYVYTASSTNKVRYPAYWASSAYKIILRNPNFDETYVYFYKTGDAYGGLEFQFSLSLRVLDRDGNPINQALVTIREADGTQVFSGTTDGNGQIAQQNLRYKWSNTGVWTVYTPHTVIISKAGYVTKTIKYTMDRKREEIEVLEKVKDYNFSKKGKIITQ